MNCKIITRIARRNNGLSHKDLFAVKDGYGYVENEKFRYRFKVTDLIKEDGTYDTLLLPHTAIKRTSSYSAYFNYAFFNLDDLVPEVEITTSIEKLKYLAKFAPDSQSRYLSGIFFMEASGQNRMLTVDLHTMCWDTVEVTSGSLDDGYGIPLELVKLAILGFEGNVKISMNKDNVWISNDTDMLVGERMQLPYSEETLKKVSICHAQYLRTAKRFNPPKDLALSLTHNKLLHLEKNCNGDYKTEPVDTPTGLSDAIGIEKEFSILSNQHGIISNGYGLGVLDGDILMDAETIKKTLKTKKNIHIYYTVDLKMGAHVFIDIEE